MTAETRDRPERDGLEAMYAAARQRVGTPAVATPTAAVVVVPWRPAPDGGVELFFVRRAASMAFLGGFWAFPGGRVDPGDASHEAAAARELREETGVEVEPGRGFCDAGEWITPDHSPLRYRARYYLARMPTGAVLDVAASAGELDRGLWIGARDALARIARGELLVPSPVLRVARALAVGRDGAEARIAAEAAAELSSPRFWELSPTVAVVPVRTPTLPPALHTGCYLLGDEEIIVVDPASPYPDEQDQLDAVLDELAGRGRRVVEVWLTHHHGDHVADARRVADRFGVGVAAHRETAARLAKGAVDRHIADGDTRALGGDAPTTITAVHTPGHAPGHLCFLDAATRFLVAGDMVAGVGSILIDPDGGDMTAYLASLERMASLGAHALLPAHGPPIPDAAGKLADYRRHRLWREERVLAALANRAPCAAGELVAEAYSDTPPLLFPLAERSLLAHLCKLARESRAHQRDGVWHASPAPR